MCDRCLIVVICFTFALIAQINAYERCKYTDAQCLEKSVNELQSTYYKGDAELGILQIDPFFIPQITIEGANKQNNILQNYKNVNLHGFKDGKIYDMRIDKDNCIINYKRADPRLELVGDYTMVGKLLLFNINGHGAFNITLTDCKLDAQAKCERYMKKGKEFIRILELTFDLVPKKIFFDFENPIDGNEALGREVLKTVNDNSFELFNDMKYDFNKALGQVVAQWYTKMFAKHPLAKIIDL